MAGYNFSADEAYIFPSGYIQNTQDVTVSNVGAVTSGCFVLDPYDEVVNMATVNDSWAVGATSPDFPYPTTSQSDLGPFLNL